MGALPPCLFTWSVWSCQGAVCAYSPEPRGGFKHKSCVRKKHQKSQWSIHFPGSLFHRVWLETNTRVYNRISDSYTSKVSQGSDCLQGPGGLWSSFRRPYDPGIDHSLRAGKILRSSLTTRRSSMALWQSCMTILQRLVFQRMNFCTQWTALVLSWMWSPQKTRSRKRSR